MVGEKRSGEHDVAKIHERGELDKSLSNAVDQRSPMVMVLVFHWEQGLADEKRNRVMIGSKPPNQPRYICISLFLEYHCGSENLPGE